MKKIGAIVLTACAAVVTPAFAAMSSAGTLGQVVIRNDSVSHNSYFQLLGATAGTCKLQGGAVLFRINHSDPRSEFIVRSVLSAKLAGATIRVDYHEAEVDSLNYCYARGIAFD